MTRAVRSHSSSRLCFNSGDSALRTGQLVKKPL